jgi:sugar phosphate isomerase/epimerase
VKIGFSSYCFMARLLAGTMTLADVLDWIAASDGEHMELALFGLAPGSGEMDWNLDDDPSLLETLESASTRSGVELSGMCIQASFVGEPAFVAAQVERAKHHVDLADRLGMRYLRHDVTPWGLRDNGVEDVETTLPILIEASKEIAQHAARYGITTSIENHGFFVNGSERVRRVVHGVAEPNFRTTLDVGNFLCVDEDPLTATRANLPYAGFVHLKDFYIRPETFPTAEGWLRTAGGRYLLGSIVGYGDMELPAICRSIVDSGYDGYVSIEFEGLEDNLLACERGLANARTLLASG